MDGAGESEKKLGEGQIGMIPYTADGWSRVNDSQLIHSVGDTMVTAHEQIKLVLTSCWLVFMVPEGSMQASGGRGGVTNNLTQL